MTAESAPKNADRWFPEFVEGSEFEADDLEEAYAYLDSKCREGGTDTDPNYNFYAPVAVTSLVTTRTNKEKKGCIKKEKDNRFRY